MTSLQIIQGDALTELRKLPDESVHCCVTSPPYWGLRDYGVEGQLGLERTPEEYVTKMVEVFREVRRVLREDGTLWLNIGDSYAGGAGRWGGCENMPNCKQTTNAGSHGQVSPKDIPVGLKPKDLCGIPWRLAFALQADGWWLRQDIIWDKRNPMPESVTDRCTKSHEYIFLLSKSARYFFDAEAIKEAADSFGKVNGAASLRGQGHFRQSPGGPANRPGRDMQDIGRDSARNKRSIWTVATEPFSDWTPQFDEADYVSSDGKPYRASADCPIHGPLAGRRKQQMVEGDEQLNPEQLRSLDTDCRRAARQIAASVSKSLRHNELNDAGTVPLQNPENIAGNKKGICQQTPALGPTCGDKPLSRTNHTVSENEPRGDNSGSTGQCSFPAAICHSTQSHKKDRASLTNAACTSSSQKSLRTLGTSVEPLKGGQTCHSDGNSISQADWGGLPSAQKADGILSKASYRHFTCTCSECQISHFATFPPDLIKPCILAGTSARGCCPKCGAPWERVVEKTVSGTDMRRNDNGLPGRSGLGFPVMRAGECETKTTGWQPTCDCRELGDDIADLAGQPASPSSFDPIPCTVLDPFFGSGTTGQVSLELGRSCIGIELNPAYIKLAERRCHVTPGLQLA